MGYKLDDLCARGVAPVMRLLIGRARNCRTATYGEGRDLLARELAIPSLSPRHMGHVAGSMMDRLLATDTSLPPLNALMVRTSGRPGTGADKYINKWSGRRYETMSNNHKSELLAEAMQAVFAYPDWEELYRQVFGSAYVSILDPAQRTTPGEYGGPAESDEHKRLKQAIADNPRLVAAFSPATRGVTEAPLLSGDEVDVRVIDPDRNAEYLIEVKSVRSTDADLKRGLYQCVKYRAVVEAEYSTVGAEVAPISMLVTERQLPPELKKDARTLGVRTKVVVVNRRPKNRALPTAPDGRRASARN